MVEVFVIDLTDQFLAQDHHQPIQIQHHPASLRNQAADSDFDRVVVSVAVRVVADAVEAPVLLFAEIRVVEPV